MTSEPVGFSRDLPVQRVMRAVVDGQDMAIWRSSSGKLAAWENRCPHRGMRLSHGFVRGESLACLYHGWHYNSSGSCAYIPAHPDLDPPKTIKPGIFEIIEQNGVLWVSGAGGVAAPGLPENLTPVRSLTLDCTPGEAMAGFLALPPAANRPGHLSGSVMAGTANAIAYAGPDGPDNPDSPVAVVVLLQNLADDAATAHILADAEWPVQTLISLSRWGEAVRRLAEAQAGSSPGPRKG